MRKIIVLLLAVTAIAAPNVVAGSASATTPTVLGAKGFSAGHGYGWGTAHPRSISNGGDPGGVVRRIAWRHWGATRAFGYGKTAILKPTGGYYSTLGRVVLRAQRLGRSGGHRAYTRMYYRVVRTPGGPLGTWHPWTTRSGNICKSPWA